MEITFTYIVRVDGTHKTKTVTAPTYQQALAKFEAWATENTRSFCILGEEVLATTN